MSTLFQSERIAFRHLKISDAEAVLRLFNDPLYVRYIGDKGLHSLQDAEGYIRSGPQQSYAKHGFGLWAMIDKRSGRFMGLCGLLRRDDLDDPDIGYALLPECRGQGLMKEAIGATLDFSRVTLRVGRLLALVHPDNQASVTLLQGAGMRLIGQRNQDAQVSLVFALAP